MLVVLVQQEHLLLDRSFRAQTDAFQYKGQDIYHTGNNSSILNSNVTLASLGATPSSTTTTANNALPKSGGTMTGDLVMQDEMINFAAGNLSFQTLEVKEVILDLTIETGTLKALGLILHLKIAQQIDQEIIYTMVMVY